MPFRPGRRSRRTTASPMPRVSDVVSDHKCRVPKDIELEYELATLGDRILGRIIDGLIIVGYVIIIFAIIGFGNLGDFINNNEWIIFLLIIPYAFYDLMSEILLNGQSAGKKMMGIRIISLDGNQPTISQYLIRWLFRIVDFTFTGGLLATICTAASQKHQRLGDMIAGTTLVKTKPRASIQQTIYQSVETTNYVVTYPDVINLSDADVQLIREVMQTVKQTGNIMLAWQTMGKVENVLNIKNKNQEPMDFLFTVIGDYNQLTSNL